MIHPHTLGPLVNPCPSCNSQLELYAGTMVKTRLHIPAEPRRDGIALIEVTETKEVIFVACSGCEFCEEVGK